MCSIWHIVNSACLLHCTAGSTRGCSRPELFQQCDSLLYKLIVQRHKLLCHLCMQSSRSLHSCTLEGNTLQCKWLIGTLCPYV